MSENLYEITQRLLAERPRDMALADVARGAKVKPSWLSAFAAGNIPDPGVNKVQKVCDFLSTRDQAGA